MTRKQIEATLWLNNSPIPSELCDREPSLKSYGIYRRLNSGKFEFVSFCNPLAKEWFSINQKDLNKILDSVIQDGKKTNQSSLE